MNYNIKNFRFFILPLVIVTLFCLNSCGEIEPLDPALIDTNPIPALLPVLTTTASSNITTTSVSSGGNISADGGSPVTARGVVWGTNPNPTITNSKTVNGTGIGSFTSSIINLVTGNTYYVRAYATNANGTSYGNQTSFSISTPSNLPVIITTAVSGISSSSASSGGNVTADGGSPVTARGVVWGIIQNPTIADSKTVNGIGTGIFTSAISGLVGSTVYYVRAYATNANGTSYGNQVTFTTSGSGSGSSGFAMTAKINGVQFQANNPYGTNLFSSTNIWDYFPLTDYVMLQGRQGGLLGDPEINIWLKKSDIKVGTYNIGKETFNTPPSHFIDLTDNSNSVFELTLQGTITITEVNTTTKIVKGTFQFTTTDDLVPAIPVVDYTVTNGTFNYKYME
ncbi:hypothetical protein [Flavobacterium sp.]|uniref:hypothetical protein n=1 Tax=Flavobacterium sp. TaxID=239 RepID=UPI00286DD251|nr:hypothetical protein [Flavobacterium sp.]